MGVVYRAHDTLLERLVALKIISASTEENPQLRDRFFREARAAGQLSHPNIITIHDLGESDRQPYLAMEYLTGRDLQRTLQTGPAMDLGRKLEIAAAICEGLAFAHRRGVVHRDIKPANIFITDDGVVKILDFGLARMMTSELTGSNMMLGTLNYMAPEQVRGERTDHRADIFSFGVVLYELFGGRKAFEGDSVANTIYKILQEVPEPLRNLDATLPPEVIAIVDRALAKSRDERYPELSEVARDLAAVRHQYAPESLTGPISTPARPPSDPPAAIRTPLPASAPREWVTPLSDPSAPTVLAEAWRGSVATSAPQSPPTPAPGRNGSRTMIAAGVLAVAGLAGAAWWATQRDTAPPASNAAALPAPPSAAAPSSPAPPTAPAVETSAQTPRPQVPDSNVDDARSRMTRAKTAARAAGASATASPAFGAASAAEREATRLLDARRPAEAAAKFYEASGLYHSAELTARTAAASSQPSVRAGRASQGDQQAAATSPTATSPAPRPVEPSPIAPPVQSPPPIVPQPTQPQPAAPPPVTLQLPPASPVKGSPQAAPTPPEPVPADVGMRDLTRRYALALEARSIEALKRLWPSLPRAQEDALRKEFTHAREIDVEVTNVEVATSGNSATATFLRRYMLVTVDGQRLLTDSRTIITARRAGPDWLIEQIRFEAIR